MRVDGVDLNEGDYVLLIHQDRCRCSRWRKWWLRLTRRKHQHSPRENGVYVLRSGTWERP